MTMISYASKGCPCAVTSCTERFMIRETAERGDAAALCPHVVAVSGHWCGNQDMVEASLALTLAGELVNKALRAITRRFDRSIDTSRRFFVRLLVEETTVRAPGPVRL